MTSMLSRIERELVISYLSTSTVNFTLIPHEPAEQIFTYLIDKERITALSEGIILFKEVPKELYQLIGQKVEIRFYFKKLGLSFFSVISCTKAGAIAIPVSKDISRIEENYNLEEKGFSCTLFLGESFTGESIQCVLKDDFPLFNPFLWHQLQKNPAENLLEKLQRYCSLVPVNIPLEIKKILAQRGKAVAISDKWISKKIQLPFDGLLRPQDIIGEVEFQNTVPKLESGFYFLAGRYLPEEKGEDALCLFMKESLALNQLDVKLQLLPICRFLAMEEEVVQGAVENRAVPFELLFITNKEIIFGYTGQNFPLQEDVEYSLLVHIPVLLLRRVITMACIPISIFKSNNKIAVLCKLTKVKEEDFRFLTELTYTQRYK